MGLKTTIATAIGTAFTALGASASDGLQVSVSYYRVTALGSYNTSTGVKTPTEALSTFDSIFYAARDREIDGIKILVDDKRLVFPQSRIAFAPSQDDRIEIGTDKYNIVNIIPDPAEATFVLHIRGT